MRGTRRYLKRGRPEINLCRGNALMYISGMSSEKSVCKKCGKDFLILVEEQEFLKKKKLPMPVECPKCRQDKRLSMRNERTLYKRKCDKCSKMMISPYRPESEFVVYCQECFWEYVG